MYLYAFCHIDSLFSNVFVQPQEKGKTKQNENCREATLEPTVASRAELSHSGTTCPRLLIPFFARATSSQAAPKLLHCFRRESEEQPGEQAPRVAQLGCVTSTPVPSAALRCGRAPQKRGGSVGLMLSRVWGPYTLQSLAAVRRAVGPLPPHCLTSGSCSSKWPNLRKGVVGTIDP